MASRRGAGVGLTRRGPFLTAALTALIAVGTAVGGVGVFAPEALRSVLDVSSGGGMAGAEADASAQARASDGDVVVEALTTPTEITVAHPDGSFTRTVSPEPVRTRSDSGWRDISTRLVSDSSGGRAVWRPENAIVDVRLGGGGNADLAVLDDRRGHAIRQSWPFGDLPAPAVDGNTATYRDVLPGVDLVQIVRSGGVSQVLKINTPEAARDPRVGQMRILLEAQNTVVEESPGGGLSARGMDTGRAELRTGGGQWWDSSVPGASVTDPGGAGITRPFRLGLEPAGGGKSAQVFGMDAVLNAAGTVFPVYVDPDWTANPTGWVYVDTAYPETSYWNGQYTDYTGHVGLLRREWAPDGVAHLARTYFQFNTTAMAGKEILKARLNTVLLWSPSCTPSGVASWLSGTVGPGTTWNAQPGLHLRTDVGSVAMGYDASCPAGTVGFDLTAGKGVLQSSSTWTVMLAAASEFDDLSWKKFRNDPTLTVTYNTAPSTPSIHTVQGGRWAGGAGTEGPYYVTRNRNPVYTVWAGDPDGAVGGPITVFFSVYRASDGALMTANDGLSASADGSYVSWQGQGTLDDGAYYLLSQVRDTWGSLSGVMRFGFRVDGTAPPAPVVAPLPGAFDSAGHDPFGKVGQAYEFTLSNPGGSTPVEGFVYAVTSGAAAVTYPADAACGAPQGGYTVVCPADGMQARVSVNATGAALDTTTTLTVWSFDHAGNTGAPMMGAPSHYTFTVPAASPAKGEGDVLDLALGGAASWVPKASADCGPPPGPGPGTDVLSLPAGSTALTAAPIGSAESGALEDAAVSFGVSGWFCPKAVGAGIQDLISQQNSSGYAVAALRLKDGRPELWAQAPKDPDWEETVTAGQALVAGRWAFIAAVYDLPNREMRLSVSTDGYTGTWTEASAPADHTGSEKTSPARIGGGFVGQVYQPVLVPGVIQPDLFHSLQASYPAKKGLLH